MSFQVYIIPKTSVVPSLWNGGSTFEYFIYPPTATYAARDFLFRISSASIEISPSTFTQFDGFFRYLVMLDNPLNVNHAGRERKFDPHAVFTFLSDETVISTTKGNDFNWMISRELNQHVLTVSEGELRVNSAFVVLFTLEATVLHIEAKTYELAEFTCCVIENPKEENILLNSNKALIFGTLHLD